MCFLIVFAEHAGFYKAAGIPALGELCAMSVFLMMSGFLMVYSYMDRDIANDLKGCFRFSTGKIKKLYPLHVETAIIQLVIIILLYWEIFRTADQVHLESFFFRFGVNLGLMQAWVPDFQNYVFNFNGPSWFLSVMLFAYLLFPLFLKLLKKLGTIKKVLILAVCLIVATVAVEFAVAIFTGFIDTSGAAVQAASDGLPAVRVSSSPDVFTWFTQNSPITRTVDFFLGCIMGYIYLLRRKEKDIDAQNFSKGKWTVIEIAAILVFYIVSYFIAAGLILGCGDVGKTLVFCSPLFQCAMAFPVLLVCIYSRGYVTKFLSWKPLVYLGNISMYTYLIHYIFTQAWASIKQGTNYDDSGIVQWIAIVVEFALTIGCSILYDKLQKKKAAKAKAKAAAIAEAKAAQ